MPQCTPEEFKEMLQNRPMYEQKYSVAVEPEVSVQGAAGDEVQEPANEPDPVPGLQQPEDNPAPETDPDPVEPPTSPAADAYSGESSQEYMPEEPSDEDEPNQPQPVSSRRPKRVYKRPAPKSTTEERLAQPKRRPQPDAFEFEPDAATAGPAPMADNGNTGESLAIGTKLRKSLDAVLDAPQTAEIMMSGAFLGLKRNSTFSRVFLRRVRTLCERVKGLDLESQTTSQCDLEKVHSYITELVFDNSDKPSISQQKEMTAHGISVACALYAILYYSIKFAYDNYTADGEPTTNKQHFQDLKDKFRSIKLRDIQTLPFLSGPHLVAAINLNMTHVLNRLE